MPRKSSEAFGVRPVLGREDPPDRLSRSEWIRQLARDGKKPREILEITGATWDHYRSAMKHTGRRGRKAPLCPVCQLPIRRLKKDIYLHIGNNVLAGECGTVRRRALAEAAQLGAQA